MRVTKIRSLYVLVGLLVITFNLKASDDAEEPNISKTSSSMLQKTPNVKAETDYPHSPRYSSKMLETLVKSAKKIYPSHFYTENEPEVTLDLLKNILGETVAKLEDSYRVFSVYKDHRYAFWSKDLNNISQIAHTDKIIFFERAVTPENLGVTFWSYVLVSKERQKKHLFWITHFQDSKFSNLSEGDKILLKQHKSSYLASLFQSYQSYELGKAETKESDKRRTSQDSEGKKVHFPSRASSGEILAIDKIFNPNNNDVGTATNNPSINSPRTHLLNRNKRSTSGPDFSLNKNKSNPNVSDLYLSPRSSPKSSKDVVTPRTDTVKKYSTSPRKYSDEVYDRYLFNQSDDSSSTSEQSEVSPREDDQFKVQIQLPKELLTFLKEQSLSLKITIESKEQCEEQEPTSARGFDHKRSINMKKTNIQNDQNSKDEIITCSIMSDTSMGKTTTPSSKTKSHRTTSTPEIPKISSTTRQRATSQSSQVISSQNNDHSS